MNVKQVIVMRHDLGMRRGKQIAQGAHASMMFITQALQGSAAVVNKHSLTEAEQYWLENGYKKICCRVNSELELDQIYEEAVKAGLTAHMVVDSGLTEFGGQPTKTCIAIGPDDADEIDKVTGFLDLL